MTSLQCCVRFICHGLLGFDKIRWAGELLPGLEYWRGIVDALTTRGVKVIVASVPPSASIETRAKALAMVIRKAAKGQCVNLIGHSMVMSLTTVATPHHGSSFADYCFDLIGPRSLPWIYRILKSASVDTDAFQQLRTEYMRETFNEQVRDVQDVQYFSYGASTQPSFMSAFRYPHAIIQRKEGPNDGLVSVNSSQWGTYEGTLLGVNHLDTINWYNRIQYFASNALGKERKFNAVAFYCAIIEKLADRGF
ncbi:triacylglycerol lipase [Geopyxis carbonaria]|nr:triacylglycerol lipase [Geopyxis carbonaria]